MQLESQEYESAFDRWYAIYPKKQARSVAEKSWQKMKLDAAATTIIEKTKDFVESYREQGKLEYLPMPATFLNQRRWEDQIQKPAKTNQPAPIKSRPTNLRHRMYNGSLSARSCDTESVEDNCKAFNAMMERYDSPHRDYNY